jgi:gas vesicle protein
MEENINEYNGFIGIVKPGEQDVEYIDFSFNTSEAGLNDAFLKIIDLVTNTDGNTEIPGKIANAGYLPSPFNEFTMFMDYDQFNPDTEYNVGFYGTPIYGNMAFLQVDLDSEDGKVIPIEENMKKTLSDGIKNMKKFEKDAGIYDSMIKTDKTKFLEEFIKEQNSILNESTKDIKGDNYDELQKAKEELKDLTGSTETIDE